ncbi:MAG: helix-turn-helix domain-containing protein [Saprospiraceae bacterium]
MENLEVNIIVIANLLALIQGVILGMVLIFTNRKNRPSLFLGLFLLLYSIELIDTILYDTFFYEDNPQWLLLPIFFYFATVPLLYLYTKSLIQPISIKKHIGILIPGFVEFFVLLILFFLPTPTKLEVFDSSGFYIFHSIGSLVFSIYWVIRILLLINTHQKAVDNFYSQTNGKYLNWVKSVGIFMIFFYSIWLVEPLMSEDFYFNYAYPFLTMINFVFIYWVAISGIRQFAVPTEMQESNINQPTSYNEEMVVESVAIISESQTDKEIVSKESNTPNPKFLELVHQIQTKKLYTDADLTLKILSQKVMISMRELSQLINQEAGVNFNVFINQYRIEEAKQLLVNPKFDHLTILGIAYEVGFNSKATFYSMFKKFTNTTPTKYKNTQQKAK